MVGIVKVPSQICNCHGVNAVFQMFPMRPDQI